MRVDKWIWAVRMVKSRTLSGFLCKSGKVLVNGVKVKSSKQINLNDIVEVTQKKVYQKYLVIGFLEKRTSAQIAAQNYKNLTPVLEKSFDKNVSDETYLKLNRAKRKDGKRTKSDYQSIRQVRWDE